MHNCLLSPKGDADNADFVTYSSRSVLVLTLSFDHSLRSHLSSGGPKDKTLLLFVIRDHIGSTPMENLRATIMADLDRIWDSLSKVSWFYSTGKQATFFSRIPSFIYFFIHLSHLSLSTFCSPARRFTILSNLRLFRFLLYNLTSQTPSSSRIRQRSFITSSKICRFQKGRFLFQDSIS